MSQSLSGRKFILPKNSQTVWRTYLFVYSESVSLFLPGNYATLSILPAPKPLPNATDKSDGRVRGRALKFMKRGRRLIVSYLNHGIV